MAFQFILMHKAIPASPSVIISDTIKAVSFDPNKLPKNYSSDHRLSGFGSLSGGVTISKQFAKGLTLETGFEYYTHQGELENWRRGRSRLCRLRLLAGECGHQGQSGCLVFASRRSRNMPDSHHDHAAHAPAGVMFDHMLPAGGFMVGYRYMWNSQSGDMLNGANAVSDASYC